MEAAKGQHQQHVRVRRFRPRPAARCFLYGRRPGPTVSEPYAADQVSGPS